MKKQIIYNGWPIAYMQGSPEASHLETLLTYHPANFEGTILLPAEIPLQPPDNLNLTVIQTDDSDWGRLRWEQRILPQVAHTNQAGYIHTTSGGVALFSTVQTLYSPAGFSTPIFGGQDAEKGGFLNRLRRSLAHGGAENHTLILWPEDLPLPETDLPHKGLPPIVHPAFRRVGQFNQVSNEPISKILPADYLLYDGPKNPDLIHKLLSAWSWASGSIGDNYHLVILNLRENESKKIQDIICSYDLEKSVLSYPPVQVEDEASIFRSASALIHLGKVSPWGGAIRKALASGTPIVGVEDKLINEIIGPAAYLVKLDTNQADTIRRLGAAIITIIIENPIAESLSQSGVIQAEKWTPEKFADELSKIYRYE